MDLGKVHLCVWADPRRGEDRGRHSERDGNGEKNRKIGSTKNKTKVGLPSHVNSSMVVNPLLGRASPSSTLGPPVAHPDWRVQSVSSHNTLTPCDLKGSELIAKTEAKRQTGRDRRHQQILDVPGTGSSHTDVRRWGQIFSLKSLSLA